MVPDQLLFHDDGFLHKSAFRTMRIFFCFISSFRWKFLQKTIVKIASFGFFSLSDCTVYNEMLLQAQLSVLGAVIGIYTSDVNKITNGDKAMMMFSNSGLFASIFPV